ncbi:hypothetical protein [Paramuribaculum intestinale]|uniref:hypothetical protein n=1 Tax=Paramuribaculum intestinale TaxID=2094151 RepID=UPI0025A9D310|nr:hypothetical protein [Paramuribaculum intestinale]
MKNLTLTGGFHNCSPIRVRISDDQMTALKDGESLDMILSDNQIKKLERHFCGVSGCTCGSWRRAEIEW